MSSIKLRFLGGAQEVGRSGVLLEGQEKLLMDYGVKLKSGEGEGDIPQYPDEAPLNLDAVLVSHAHMDHSGFVPSLYHRGYYGPVYSTATTFDLAKVLLKDSIKLARLKNQEEKFSEEDLQKMEEFQYRITYGQNFSVGDSLIEVFNAGHIPGSASFYIKSGNKSIIYSGDINTSDTRLIKGFTPNYPDTDILIVESTYSQRDHPPREEQEKELISKVKETLENGGIALIPSFAVARSQEILLILDKYKINSPIYLDGMSIEASKIILSYPEFLREPKRLKKIFNSINLVHSNKQREKATKTPSVIVTTSGMLNGGPVSNYIKKIYKRGDSSILMTGYQVKNSAGRKLLETGHYINEGLNLKVNCSFEKIDLSAHLGRKELFEYVKKVSPQKVFAIHGDECNLFAKELRELGFDAVAPERGKEYLI